MALNLKNDVTICLHGYEAEALIRLLSRHIVGPDDGPRGILTDSRSGVLTKLFNATNTSIEDVIRNLDPFIINESLSTYGKLYLKSDYDE